MPKVPNETFGIFHKFLRRMIKSIILAEHFSKLLTLLKLDVRFGLDALKGGDSKGQQGLAVNKIKDVRMTTQQISSSERTNNSLEAIRVEVRGNGGEIIPRLPMLKVGDTEYGGIHTIIYDENNNFESGVFVFVLPQGVSAANIINNPNTVISVSEVLVKSTIKTTAFNNEGVTELNVLQ